VKTWGWGFISLAALLVMVTQMKSWQLALLIFLVGLIMVIRGKEAPKDGDSEDDKSVK
jgi:hypothetical protein